MNRPVHLISVAAVLSVLLGSCTPPPVTLLTQPQKRVGSSSAAPLAEWSTPGAVDAGVQSVMIGHLAVPALDCLGLPASLSAPMVSDLLRKEIGFRGLIVTDGLEMRALTRGFTADTVAVLAVRAGADILLVPPDPDLAVNAVVGAVRRGEITEERVNESVRRILALKHQLGLDGRRTVDIDAIASRIGTKPNRHLAREIARDAVTLLRNKNGVLPLPPDGPMRIVAVLSQLLRRRSPGSEIFRLSPESDVREVNDAVMRALGVTGTGQ